MPRKKQYWYKQGTYTSRKGANLAARNFKLKKSRVTTRWLRGSRGQKYSKIYQLWNIGDY